MPHNLTPALGGRGSGRRGESMPQSKQTNAPELTGGSTPKPYNVFTTHRGWHQKIPDRHGGKGLLAYLGSTDPIRLGSPSIERSGRGSRWTKWVASWDVLSSPSSNGMTEAIEDNSLQQVIPFEVTHDI